LNGPKGHRRAAQTNQLIIWARLVANLANNITRFLQNIFPEPRLGRPWEDL
jgi:hypothetical protein